MKKIFLFLIIFLIVLKTANSQLVYICTGEYAKVFHSRDNCTGLNNCKGEIIKVFQSDAMNKYKLQRPCCVCWYPSPIGCATDNMPINNQPTKFNPYVPQFSNEEEMKLYAYANAKRKEEEAKAYAAAGSLVFGAISGSNDFYIHNFKTNNSKFNNKNRKIEDYGYDFGFRATFPKTAIEWGASIISQDDFSGEEGGNIKWGAHFNYLYNIQLIKRSEKATLYIGATVNSFFTKSEPFGGGGIAGLSVKVASWLKLDGRYEITNTTDRISTGFFLTYNKK